MCRKIIVITGGSSGLGEAIVKRLLGNENNYVYSIDTKIPTFQHNRFQHVMEDIRSAEALSGLLRRLAEVTYIDSLILNAGVFVSELKGATDYNDEEWSSIMDINFYANCNLLRALIPLLLKGQYACIIGILSDKIYQPTPWTAPYTVSKMALLGFLNTLALELKGKIRVNTISPSVVNSDLVKDLLGRAGQLKKIPLEFLNVDGVANIVDFLLSTDSLYLNGVDIPVKGNNFYKLGTINENSAN
ncbi:MAG: SDR family oxidoreductase [Bacteroidales bacterium]|jgi:NAD(P)-dependent dehydrogenase (short-subunit alcohol dehydrogenase family)|nr:SDR family oxidoreductase [Bacteroidales bacterium]